MINNDLLWILNLEKINPDSNSKREYGVQIGTLDNPGWYLKVNLKGTKLHEKKMEEMAIDRSETDWIYCSIKDQNFEGFGGPFNLPEILKIFREWATTYE